MTLSKEAQSKIDSAKSAQLTAEGKVKKAEDALKAEKKKKAEGIEYRSRFVKLQKRAKDLVEGVIKTNRIKTLDAFEDDHVRALAQELGYFPPEESK